MDSEPKSKASGLLAKTAELTENYQELRKQIDDIHLTLQSLKDHIEKINVNIFGN